MMKGCLLALTLLAPGIAHGQRCTVSATGVAFGTYVPTSSRPTDNAGAVAVSCNRQLRDLQISIALNPGQNSGGAFRNRQMRARLSFLQYQLYVNPSRTVIWGDGSAGTSTVNDVMCRRCPPATYPVYGRLPGRQLFAAPGSYTDVITVIVTFN
jgi:spore coat protein U-like protein